MAAVTEPDDQLDPAQSVQRDTCNIRKARAAFIISVSLATAIGAWNVHRGLENLELAYFEREFKNTAQKLVKSLLQSTHRKLDIGYDKAATVRSVLQLHSSLTNLSIPLWQDICASSMYLDSVYLVALSPMIFTTQQAEDVTTFLKTKVATPPSPPCFLCANETERFVNPHNQTVQYPGHIVVTCAEVEQTALSGLELKTEEHCRQTRLYVQEFCDCGPSPNNSSSVTGTFTNTRAIFRLDNDTGMKVSEDKQSLPFVPVLEFAGRGLLRSPLGWDQYSDEFRFRALSHMKTSGLPVFTETYTRTGSLFDNYLGSIDELGVTEFFPIVDEDNQLVGVISVDFGWSSFVREVFPVMAQYMVLVLANTCGQTYTFQFDEIKNSLELIGEGDQHDRSFDSMVQESSIRDFESLVELVGKKHNLTNETEFCRYQFCVYPTMAMRDHYLTMKPIVSAVGIVLITFVALAAFWIYDCLVQKRQDKVLGSAIQNAAVVSMLYPSFIRGRLFQQRKKAKVTSSGRPLRTRLSAFLLEESSNVTNSPEPIAEFFPSVSVMFLDLVGFTAWCSDHEPKHVFHLLEALYEGFDRLARERGIFKVETVGDCYLAVAGLPESRTDHAVMIAWFAHDCIQHLQKTCQELAETLGTGHLSGRCGIHSGPVVAGVLRGDKARFQLFGDVLNTCSRLESSCCPDLIHASYETVELLRRAGYSEWVEPRSPVVQLKGKGELQTYWVHPSSSTSCSLESEQC